MNQRPNLLKPVGPASLADENDFQLGGIQVRPSLREVEADGVRENLESRVMQVLVALARTNGAVVSRDELIRQCWGGRVVGDDAINRCVAKVRQLSEFGGSKAFDIETIPRVGYRLVEQQVDGPLADAAPAPEPVIARVAESTPHSRYRLAAVALLVAVGFATFFFLYRPTGQALAPTAGTQRANRAAPSIAVLPFRNLSASADASYFAEGIQDEILTRLAKIGSLKVISRTSTESYAGKAQNLKQIARQLGVDNVLEGSVQRDGSRVRINVQLIRVSSDSHVWAEDYDRNLSDIFAVESEVARAIASTLAARITRSESRILNAKPTSNPKAYDLYLRALVQSSTGKPNATETAAALVEQAVRSDPDFAAAWALLSRLDSYMAMDAIAGRRELARRALMKAKALDPQLPETQVAAGLFKYYAERDYRGALMDFAALYKKWPNNVEVLRSLGLLSRRVGRWEDARVYMTEALALDPRTVKSYTWLAFTLDALHRSAEAVQVINRGLVIWPQSSELLFAKASILQGSGQLDAAAAVLARIPDGGEQDIAVRWSQYLLERRYADGARYFERLLSDPDARKVDETMATLLTSAGDLEMRAGQTGKARSDLLQARDLWLKLLRQRPQDTNVLDPLALTYVGLGDKAAATQTAERGMTEYPLSRDTLEGGKEMYLRAMVAARFGDRAAAMPLLKQVSSIPGGPVSAVLRLDPNFDKLRGDPGFEKLVHAAGK